MDLLEQTKYQRLKTKVKYVVKHTERQGSRHTVKVLILREFESNIKSFSMKRQSSVTARPRRGQHSQKDFKASPKKHVATKTNNETKQRNLRSGRSTFTWDPDSFCSESDSSVVDLTDMNDHETERLGNVISTRSSEDVVVLSAGEKDKISQSGSVKLRQKSLSHIQFGKISLPPGSMAEDTLETLRLNKDSAGLKLISDDPFRSHIENSELSDSQLDDNNSVASGPCSPHTALIALRCRKCKGLFTKMARQRPSKQKKMDYNPGSLSCDVWLLTKPWHPQKRRQVKGKLWVHLKRIRKLAVEDSRARVTQTACSRPHVFLQRNLRRCREISSMLSGPSESRTMPRRRCRPRNTWPPVTARYRKQNKKPPLDKHCTSQHISTLDFASDITEGNLPAKNDAHHAGLQRQEKFLKKQSNCDVSGLLGKQADCDGLEGTRRVLKFDDSLSTLSVNTQKPRQGFVHKSAKRKQNEDQTDFTVKVCDHPRAENVQSKVLEKFRTPPDLFSEESKIIRKSRSSLFSPCHSSHGAEKNSFRSMLAAFEKSRNQIIKESHN